jgi:hypothetical protein
MKLEKMASQMMYIHVCIPFKLNALYDQADLFTLYLQTLKNTTTSIYKCIPFTKAACDTGNYRFKRMKKILKKLENIEHNLPHV